MRTITFWYTGNNVKKASLLSQKVFLLLACGATFLLSWHVLNAASCHLITQSSQTPSGYASPVSFFGGGLLIKGDCNAGSIAVTVGNGEPTTYIYDKSYLWTGSQWQAKTLTGSNKQGAWIPEVATTNLTSSQSPTYYVAYTCEWVNQAWKCGCTTSSCTTNQWQLQMFQAQSSGQGGGGSLPSPVRTISVSNNSQFTSALSSAQPGDHIILANGTYSGFSSTRSGTEDKPIVIRAASTLGAKITSESSVSGNNVWVYGMSFSGTNVTLSVSGMNNTVMANKFEGWARRTAVFPGSGQGITIAYNEFTNPDPYTTGSLGAYPLRMGIRSSHRDDAHRNAHVHHNYFHTFPEKPTGQYDSGQADAIEVCYTGSNISSGWLIEYNLIENQRSGSGILDVKCSRDAVIRYNSVINSPNGRIDLRNGSGAQLIANWIENSGGIGIHGDAHEVIGNVVRGGGAIYLPSGNIQGDVKSEPTVRQASRNVTLTCNEGTHVLGAWKDSTYSLAVVNTKIQSPSGSVQRTNETGTQVTNDYNCSQAPKASRLSVNQVGPSAAPQF